MTERVSFSATAEFIARDLVRLWMNQSALGTSPEILVRVGNTQGSAKYLPKWDGRTIQVEVGEADVRSHDLDAFRQRVLLPILWRLLPSKQRKNYLRNRVLASMRVAPTDEWITAFQ